MTAQHPTALIAEDEPLLRDALERLLTAAWPELSILARARNGREAIDQFDAYRPDVCFLDVHMPGINGVEAARRIGGRAHLVFITAFSEYAVQAFSHGVLDYLVKPVETVRLVQTVVRLKARLQDAQRAIITDAQLEQLAISLERSRSPYLRWIKASLGQTVTLISVSDIDFFRAEEKYTVVAWRDAAGEPSEAVIRTALKDLTLQLDTALFAQVHRSVVVNLTSIAHVLRGPNETASIHLKGRSETLPVSRNYLHLFRQM